MQLVIHYVLKIPSLYIYILNIKEAIIYFFTFCIDKIILRSVKCYINWIEKSKANVLKSGSCFSNGGVLISNKFSFWCF